MGDHDAERIKLTLMIRIHDVSAFLREIFLSGDDGTDQTGPHHDPDRIARKSVADFIGVFLGVIGEKLHERNHKRTAEQIPDYHMEKS